MTDDERIEQLETRLDQVQLVNEQLFTFILQLLYDPNLRAAIESKPEASDWIRIMAGAREDQGDHIAAHLLERISDRIKD
jgi:hypothetical protein